MKIVSTLLNHPCGGVLEVPKPGRTNFGARAQAFRTPPEAFLSSFESICMLYSFIYVSLYVYSVCMYFLFIIKNQFAHVLVYYQKPI